MTDCVFVTTAQLNNDVTGPLAITSIVLKSGDFSALSSITSLTIDGNGASADANSLMTLPAGIFSDLSAVTELNINRISTLTAIESGAFTGLTNITTLTLNDNSIAQLPNDVFAPLAGAASTLTSLALQNNDLSDFPTVALSGLTKLVTFNIAGNPEASPQTFTIPYELVLTSNDESRSAVIEVRLPLYVPSELRDLAVELSATDGMLALAGGTPATSVTVALNTPVEVTATGTEDVTVSIATVPDHDASNGMEIGTGSGLTVMANAPATGTPLIVRDTPVATDLTIDITGIQDSNDVPNPFEGTYQWQRSTTKAFGNPSVISGATANTYTLTNDDLGKYLRVIVNFDDEQDNPESLTSAPFGIPATTLCDRTPQVRKAILDKITTVEDCVFVTTAQLNDINGTLDLSNSDPVLESLKVGDFADLTGITRLGIGGNDAPTNDPNGTPDTNTLTRLPAGVFDGLSAVTVLVIRNLRDLDTIEAGAFTGLTNVSVLVLSGNGFESLPADLFTPLASSLTRLDLQNNRLSDFPTAALSGITTAINLSLQGAGAAGGIAGGNPGAPFTIPYELVRTNSGTDSPATIRVNLLPLYVPSSLRGQVSLSATNGATLVAGSSTGKSITADLGADVTVTAVGNLIVIVSATPASTDPVKGIRIGSATLTAIDGNNPATGLPVITGLTDGGAMVPAELTADVADIADIDGLGGFTYQWQRSATNDFSADINLIEGATAAAYTLTDDDALKYIRVIVSFTDEADYSESLTSAIVGPIVALPNRTPSGLPTIIRLMDDTIPADTPLTVPHVLMADITDIADEDGLEMVTFRYQWYRGTSSNFDFASDGDNSVILDPVTGAPATGSTYKLTDADAGKYILVIVAFADDRGAEETINSEATAQIAERPNREPKGLPTITGTLIVPQELTAGIDNISDEDGLEMAEYSYLWQRSTSADFSSGTMDIGVATSSNTYSLDDADEEKYIRVIVSFTDDRGADESVTSEATDTTITRRPNRAPVGLPTIAGKLIVPEELTAVTTGISDEDGPATNPEITFSYQWQRSTASDFSASVTLIESATAAAYALTDDDAGKYIRVVVTFTDGRQKVEELISAPTTSAISSRDNTLATGAPTISRLTQTTPADAPLTVPHVLMAAQGTIADADGLPPLDTGTDPFSYQWQRSSDPDNFTNPVDIENAVGSTYMLTDADAGKYIRVVVSFTDMNNFSESVPSAATAQIVQRPNRDATGTPIISSLINGITTVLVNGKATVPATLIAVTDSIADLDDLGTFTYQWHRGDASNFTVIDSPANNTTAIVDPGTSELATGDTYTLTDDDAGKYIRVRVSFTDGRGAEETLTSAATSAIVARPNRDAQGAPTISGADGFIVPQTLTAARGSIADDDGLPAFDTGTDPLRYQWQRSASSGLDADPADINGANASTYELTDADAEQYIRVVVSFTDEREFPEEVESVYTPQIGARPNRDATGTPVISSISNDITTGLVNNKATVPATLIAVTDTIADLDGLEMATFTYQWQSSTSEIFNPAETSVLIATPDPTTYTLTDDDEGQYIRVVVSFTDDREFPEEVTSEAIGPVDERPNRAPVGLPTITRLTQTTPADAPLTVPHMLMAVTTGITDPDGNPSSYNYLWQRSNTADFENANANVADLTTGATYTLADADAGKYIRVVASFTDGRQAEETLTSAATAQIVRTPQPSTGRSTRHHWHHHRRADSQR